jgi:hypothetical protein
MTATYEDLAVLRFEGERFENHTLDVDTTLELIAYKKLVLECAKELWRRRNPGRFRLPRGFEEGFALAFSEIRQGSAGVPLKRRIERRSDELELPSEDEFIHAARLLDEAIEAAGSGQALPSDLPRNVIPLFREFGRTLLPDESVFIRSAGRPTESAYTAPVRERLGAWTDPTYEDVVEVCGEVSMASIRGQFTLTLESGETPSGRFSPEQEALVLEALRDHRNIRLRLRAIAEFNQADRSLRRFVHVEKAELAPIGAETYDDSVPPVWEVVSRLGSEAPPGTWDDVPSDLSRRVDEYVYGSPRTE